MNLRIIVTEFGIADRVLNHDDDKSIIISSMNSATKKNLNAIITLMNNGEILLVKDSPVEKTIYVMSNLYSEFSIGKNVDIQYQDNKNVIDKFIAWIP